ncbi:aminoglycoside phosphotransferase family protein [Dactylosporangium cerinum]|uniref:Aminoglycoside phosphotransferase family protein n=1 Tax=Dactylosporangium cerinum TaxID=1434730 RepID=A0ABV9VZV6_9ACTN
MSTGSGSTGSATKADGGPGSTRPSRPPVESGPANRLADFDPELAGLVADAQCFAEHGTVPAGWTLEQTGTKVGPRSFVFNVPHRDRDAILKIHLDPSRYAAKEARALHLLSGDPGFPRILHQRLGPPPTLTIAYRLPGATLDRLPPSAVMAALPAVIGTLRRVHAVTLDFYGELVGDFASAPNSARLDRYITANRDYWARNIGQWSALPGAAASAARISSLRPPAPCLADRPTLIHGDLTLDNIVAADTGVGIIDFDGALSMFPEYDLATLFWSLTTSDVPLGLPDFCRMVSEVYGRPPRLVEDAIRAACWLPIVRSLNLCRRAEDPVRFADLWLTAAAFLES